MIKAKNSGSWIKSCAAETENDIVDDIVEWAIKCRYKNLALI